jgi:hypothetical protein
MPSGLDAGCVLSLIQMCVTTTFVGPGDVWRGSTRDCSGRTVPRPAGATGRLEASRSAYCCSPRKRSRSAINRRRSKPRAFALGSRSSTLGGPNLLRSTSAKDG